MSSYFPRVFALILLMLSHADLLAQTFPEKPVSIVVPYPPGGSNDIFARGLAAGLREVWKRSVLVENRPGANGSIGVMHVVKAAPDGYTLLLTSSVLTIAPAIDPQTPYDPVKDFAPVAFVGRGPMALIASLKSPAGTPRELFAAARQKPGGLTYATTGFGSSPHLAFELINAQARISLHHVPYKGGAQIMTDILGGHVDLYIGSLPQVMPFVRDGRVRGLAVTGTTRSSFAPDMPTLAESGLPDYDFGIWWGVYAPAGTPRAIVVEVNRQINNLLRSDEMKNFLAREAAVPSPLTPEQFADIVKTDAERWRSLAREAKIQQP